MHCIDILWFREILANVFGCTVLNSSVCHQLHAPIAGFETETFVGFDTGTNSGLRYRHNADGAPALEHFDIFSVCFLTKPMHFFWLFQCIPKLHFHASLIKTSGQEAILPFNHKDLSRAKSQRNDPVQTLFASLNHCFQRVLAMQPPRGMKVSWLLAPYPSRIMVSTAAYLKTLQARSAVENRHPPHAPAGAASYQSRGRGRRGAAPPPGGGEGGVVVR
jgi:hypothetical protein